MLIDSPPRPAQRQGSAPAAWLMQQRGAEAAGPRPPSAAAPAKDFVRHSIPPPPQQQQQQPSLLLQPRPSVYEVAEYSSPARHMDMDLDRPWGASSSELLTLSSLQKATDGSAAALQVSDGYQQQLLLRQQANSAAAATASWVSQTAQQQQQSTAAGGGGAVSRRAAVTTTAAMTAAGALAAGLDPSAATRQVKNGPSVG